MEQNEILSAYTWMNNDLFERLIRKDYPNSIVSVINFFLKLALPAGENYASLVIRATVYYNIDNANNVKKQFIIKVGHIKAEVNEIILKLNLFGNEIKAINDILPKVEKLLHNIGDDTKLAPKCYEVNEEKPYIILEDLTTNGYKNVNKKIGLNVEEYKKSFTKIAKFHACTAVLMTKDEKFDYFDTCHLAKDDMRHLYTSSLLAASEYVNKKPKLAHLSNKLCKNVNKIIGKIENAITPKATDFVVLCHGDLWMNNVMFKFNESGLPMDAILLDYQCLYVGPAVVDIANHLLLCFQEDLQDREFDLIIQHYHNVLSDTLKRLNYTKPIPSLTSIQMQMLEKGVSYTPMCVSAAGFRSYENTGEDLTNFLGEDADKSMEKVLKMMLNPKVQKTTDFSIDYVNRKGYLD